MKFAISLFIFLITMPLHATPFPLKGRDIVETAVAAGSFKTLVKAVEAAHLVDALKEKGPFTVFAPTDEAFARLPSKALADLLRAENREKLASILTYHVVPGRLSAREVIRLSKATTLNGQQLDITVEENRVQIDEARLVQTDITCDNGIIHVIDQVMLPNLEDIVGTAKSAGQFNTLLKAAVAADLVSTLKSKGPFTVFAPTDEAFAKLPEKVIDALLKPENRTRLAEVLKYHVVPGRIFSTDALIKGAAETAQSDPIRFTLSEGQLKINDARVLTNDIDTSNGVIHVIDEVLIPPSLDLAAALPLSNVELIAFAINRGTPLFNDNQANACCAIYEITVRALLSLAPDSLPRNAKIRLNEALQKYQEEGDARERAWVLRRALDYTMEQIEQG